MSKWAGGYITDVPYMAGFYRLQSPAVLSLATLLNGVPTIDLAADEPLSYLELGCGMGYTAMVLAACNPTWQVTAIDFNPGHIAWARHFARSAGLANIRFLEADLATLAEDPQSAEIPESDVVSFHGIWTWVSPTVRSGVVRLLRAKVRPGGVVHASYDALPGWQGAIGLQRLINEVGRRAGGRSDRQALAGVRFAKSLLSAEALHIKNSSFATTILEGAETAHPAYLAHEYMHDHWRPCFHADVVADFAEAKLEWVGSALLPENFRQLTLTEAQQALADAHDDPLIVELIKDMCLTRCLRQDVFVRGPRRVSIAERNAALGDVTLALTCLPDRFIYELDVQAGHATLEHAFYRPIVAALHERPYRVRDLINLPEVVGRRDNPAELVAILVGTNQATPVTMRSPLADDPSARFNYLMAHQMRRLRAAGVGLALASARFGTALTIGPLEMFVYAKLRARPHEVDMDAWIAELLAELEDTDAQKLREGLDHILENRVSIWRRFELLE